MKATGGKRPNAGRPTDAIKHKFQVILDKSMSYERLGRILKNTTDDEIFLKAMQLALDRGFGKTPVSLENSDGSPLTIKLVNYA